MIHDPPLIATIVAGIGLAFVLGAHAHRFRLPPLIGYLTRGRARRPQHGPGFVADQALGWELAVGCSPRTEAGPQLALG